MAKKKKAAKKTAKTTECKPRTKTQIISGISDDTGLSRKEVTSVFDSMCGMIKKDLGRKGPGVFTVPGLMKVKKKTHPYKSSLSPCSNKIETLLFPLHYLYIYNNINNLPKPSPCQLHPISRVFI